jgi:hypothetical protein
MSTAEAIHGITFDDYAATNAFLAQGKELDTLLPVLGVEAPQWEEAEAYWLNQMTNDDSFRLITRYGEIFQNPAAGKFAGQKTETSSSALERIPDMESYIKVGEHMSVATKYGVDAQTLLGQYGLTVMDWSQVGMHWMQFMNARFDDQQFMGWFSATHQHYREHFEEEYRKSQGGGLGEDIQF